jgi:similar to stage IV sporulation protein
VETLLRQQYEDVGWVSVEKSGSVLYVRMDEVVLQEQQKETTGNLVARDAGRVVSIVTRQGTAKVRAGDKVKKGNVLISGKVKVVGDNDEVVEKKKVQAQGSVVVCSSRQYQKSIQKNVLKWEYTGRNRALYQWQIGKNNLFICNPLKNLETYEKYDIIREGGCVCPFLSLRFPVSLWKKTFREVTWQNVTYSKQEAESLLGEEYTYYLEQMKEDGCFDVTGELNVLEQADSFVGTAKITYSRQQSGDVSDS